jgi:hypothetical protein
LKESKNNRDCHFIYQHGTNKKKDIYIAKYLDVVMKNGSLTIVAQVYQSMRLLFTKPCSSARFYGYEFKDLDPITRDLAAENVIAKMYAFPNITELNMENCSAPQLGLLKFLNCTLPVDSLQAQTVPKFQEVCQEKYDAWEGIAIRHTMTGGSSLY